MSILTDYFRQIKNFSSNAKKFLLTITLNFISLGAMQVILGLYVLELGYSEDFFGLVVAGRILAIGIMAIPAGMLTSKIGTRKIMIIATLLTSLPVLALGFISTKTVIAAVNILYGTGFAIFFVNIAPFLSRNSGKEEREELFSFNFILMTAAKMFGCFLVGFLPSILLKTVLTGTSSNLLIYRYIMVILSSTSIFALLPVFSIDPVLKGEQDQDQNFIYNIKKEKVSKLSIYQFLLGAGGGLITPFFSIFLTRNLGVTTGQAGIIMFLYRLTIALTLFLTPYISQKLGRVKSVGLFQISSLPFLLAIVLVPNFAIASITFLIRGALMGVTRPLASNFAMEIVPESSQTMINGILRTSKSIARSGSATMGGWVIANYGFTPTYFMTFVLYLCGAFLFVRSFINYET